MTNPMQADDPLAPLLLRRADAGAVPLRYRSGRVVSWNVITFANQIEVDGVTFTNLPLQPGSWAPFVVVGDVVSLLSTTDERGITTYLITGIAVAIGDGRLLIPGLGGLPNDNFWGNPTGTFGGAGAFVVLTGSPTVGLGKAYAKTALKITVQATALVDTVNATVFLGVRLSYAAGGSNDVQIARLNFQAASSHATIAGTRKLRPSDLASIGAVGRVTALGLIAVFPGNAGMDVNDFYTLTMEEVL